MIPTTKRHLILRFKPGALVNSKVVNSAWMQTIRLSNGDRSVTAKIHFVGQSRSHVKKQEKWKLRPIRSGAETEFVADIHAAGEIEANQVVLNDKGKLDFVLRQRRAQRSTKPSTKRSSREQHRAVADSYFR